MNKKFTILEITDWYEDTQEDPIPPNGKLPAMWVNLEEWND